jgi:protein SCO1/2
MILNPVCLAYSSERRGTLQATTYQIKAADTMNRTGMRIALAFAACLLAAGCGASSPPPLAGATIGGPFVLIDSEGRTVRDSDFAGRYRLVYFGYTYCPDACPTDMAKLGAALRLLDKSDPALAKRLAAIFITVDPERDTPAVVGRFVANFHPRMIGLTGSPAAVDRAANGYRVYHTKQAPGPGGGYLVDHSRVIYLMGPKGEPIAALTSEMTPEAIAAEIRKWAK